MTPRLLVVGASARAIAESAARVGFDVTAIDAYADRDQHPTVRALSMPRDFGMPPTPRNTVRAAGGVASDAVAYLSPFENHPGAVRALARGRTLLGNAPDVLRRVRDPLQLTAALRQRGLPVPETTPGVVLRSSKKEHDGWLVKPRRSGGGQDIRSWDGGDVPGGCYLQQRIDGTAGSIVFAAACGSAVPLGFSRQLVGDPAFGADGFRYCGSIMAPAADPQFADGPELMTAATDLARIVAAEFRLIGVNGIDFIAANGIPCAIEVNPRWSASMELVERQFGISVFGIHAAACRGTLEEFDLSAALGGHGAAGKAILFAKHDAAAPDTDGWLESDWIRDVPRSGEPFTAGSPVCTVLAQGRDSRECYENLATRAAAVHAQLHPASPVRPISAD